MELLGQKRFFFRGPTVLGLGTRTAKQHCKGRKSPRFRLLKQFHMKHQWIPLDPELTL